LPIFIETATYYSFLSSGTKKERPVLSDNSLKRPREEPMNNGDCDSWPIEMDKELICIFIVPLDDTTKMGSIFFYYLILVSIPPFNT
jgi:hypothetical protein